MVAVAFATFVAVGYVAVVSAMIVVRDRLDEQLLAEVSADDGPGVPADDLPHVFDRFWRQDKARSRATGDSGLGLAIPASIVQLHHGSIRAEATGGGGLTVRTVLPLAAADLVQRQREIVS